MYDRILLPIDDGDDQHRAVEHAIDLADAVDASVYAVHIVDELAYDSADDERRETLEADSRDALAAVRTAAAVVGVPVETELRYGVVHEEILAATTETDADAIVVGTRGRTGLERLLAGSVAELVVRRATVPVLTVGANDGSPANESNDGALGRAAAALESASDEAADAIAAPYRTARPATTSRRSSIETVRIGVGALANRLGLAATDP